METKNIDLSGRAIPFAKRQRRKQGIDALRRRFGQSLGPLLLAIALGLAFGCGGDSVTNPDPGNGNGNGSGNENNGASSSVTFSGPGATDLASTSFEIDNQFVDGTGNLTWVDAAAAKSAGEVTITVFPNPIDPSSATSVGLLCEGTVGKSWFAINLGGVAGVSIGETEVTFADVTVSDAITGRGEVVLNGSMDRPTTTLVSPGAPAEVTVEPLDENLRVAWNGDGSADTYTVYVARQSTLRPGNYSNQSGGARYENVTSPFTFPDALAAGAVHYVVVTASNAAGEGEASALASGTPTSSGGGTDAGSLTISGSGASLLSATTFQPDAAGPDASDATQSQSFWIDHANTDARLYVFANPNDDATIFTAQFVSGDRSWEVSTFGGGVPSVTRVGSQFTFDGTALAEIGGGSTELLLTGTVNATLVYGSGPSGTLTFSGDGVGALAGSTFTPVDYRFSFGSLLLIDSNGVEVEFALTNNQNSTNTFTIRYQFSTIFLATGNPVAGFTTTGTSFSCDGVAAKHAFGNTQVVVDGTIDF